MTLPIANSDGATFRAALNTELTFLRNQNAGNARPSDAGAGTFWVDKNTPSATVWSVFFYDGSGDTLVGLWDTTNDVFKPANALLGGMGKGHITGLTYSRNGSDPGNDIDIAAGWCMDATGARQMEVTAITKRLDAAWAVGTNQGGLDTGAVGNNDYYMWAIERSDTGVVDVLFSLSATSPTMPTNYDYKRLIGWLKREGGANVDFKTYEMAGGGLDFKWTSPRLDVNIANTLTTSRRTDALSVPLNFSTVAQIRAVVFDASANPYVIICCPDEADAAPSGTAAPGSSISGVTSAVGSPVEIPVRTSATGTVASRATTATVDNFIIVTRGFEWARR